jgi:hypothetical protein
MKKLLGLLVVSFLFFLSPSVTLGYGECSHYGSMSIYNSWNGTCKCMSGYTFDKNIFGETTCVSMNTYCRNKYGFHAGASLLGNSCECSYGYVFGTDSFGNESCVNADYLCRDKHGYNSKYNNSKNTCECKSGTVFRKKTYSNELECVSCTTKHGIYAQYNYLTNKCECKSGYTLDDDNWCVEKSNSAYFFLKELNENNNEAIVCSNYNLQCYRIEYSMFGCSDWIIDDYVEDDVVINMGKDFDVDGGIFSGDYLVLHDDDTNCKILESEKVDDDFQLEDKISYYSGVSISNNCGENSMEMFNGKCQCYTGYTWESDDSSNLDCVKIEVEKSCGNNAVSSNNKCICKEGYIWESEDLTNTNCVKIKTTSTKTETISTTQTETTSKKYSLDELKFKKIDDFKVLAKKTPKGIILMLWKPENSVASQIKSYEYSLTDKNGEKQAVILHKKKLLLFKPKTGMSYNLHIFGKDESGNIVAEAEFLMEQ